jgi:RHS repeat-associated protein
VTDRDGGSTAFCYDFAGRVASKTQVIRGVTLTLRYAYTPAGRLASMTYPDGRTVAYTRNAIGEVTDVTLHGSTVQNVLTNIRHDALGRPLSWTAGARTLTRTYNLQGAVTGVTDGRPDGLDLQLAYADGLVKSITSHGETSSVTNDALGRVTAAGPLASGQHIYTYDKTGNRLSWSPPSNAKISYDYPATNHHLMLAAGTVREYDANGNTTRIGEREFVYDASGRMSQAKVNGVVEMNYAYSPFGKQIGRYIAGETTVSLYDESEHWIGDYDGAGRTTRQIVWLDEYPVALIEGDRTLDIETDQIGTPRVIVDRKVNKPVWTWEISGDAFGSHAPDEDADKDGKPLVFDMRYPGHRFDAVSRLFQGGWRDYDPSSGRFIQSDPIGLRGGPSTYGYVNGNPLAAIDPNGLSAQFSPFDTAIMADALFVMNYRDMRQANTIGADKYFHCKANCQAARLGTGGVIEATIVSEVRELTDQYIKGDPKSACDEDRAANALGRHGGRTMPEATCSSVCAPLRPAGLSGY